MKRIALAVAIVVMAAGACKKAENRNTAADSTRADTTRMADSMRMGDTMKMAPGDTTHHADTAKAHTPAAKAHTPTRTHRP